jgi:hypothetical protein
MKITRNGGAGLQHDNNLTGKFQRERTLRFKSQMLQLRALLFYVH